MDWLEEINQGGGSKNEILSFFDYMEKFQSNAYRDCRPSYKYLLDMLEYFGKTEDGCYKLFEKDHPDAPPVYGQKATQEAFVQNLMNFQEEGYNNRFILLVGPNGSSKSSIVRKLMKGAEDYSNLDEGALYTFSWIFPIEMYLKGSLGLSSTQSGKEIGTFAYLEDKEVSAILPSELRDHPLLLIPREKRQKIMEEYLEDYPDLLETVKKSYLYQGDMSKRNRMIFDALLKSYKNNMHDVFKHIRVERFFISKRYSTGAVTIEPQLHVDARMQQITMDKRLANLPPSLQSLNLFTLQGEIVMANRGILEYSDLLKRPLDTFKYLLMTIETKDINLQGIITELDIFFIGTSNEIHLAAFKQHPDFNSFKGRFVFTKVPYLLDYKIEEKIYVKQIDGLMSKSFFEPHALSTLCLFSVMTRLRSCQAKNYSNKKLASIVSNMTPLEKALFYNDHKVPGHLEVESKQILEQSFDEVRSEFNYENLYEGKFGISPREVKKVIYKLTKLHKNLTFVEIIEYLERLITKKNEYDFLNMTPQGDYHHPTRFLALIKKHIIEITDRELRESLGLIDERSYEKYIKKYIENINALIKGEKIKDSVTGKYENSNEYFTKEFETSISLKEDPKKFRSHLISKLGAFALDNPGAEIVYGDVFPDIIEKLKESFREEQKKVLVNISNNLVFYKAELDQANKSDKKSMPTPLSKDNREEIVKILKNLSERFGYTTDGALSVLKYLIKEKY